MKGEIVGLIKSGWGHYQPSLDMTGLALRLAEMLCRGRYVAEAGLAEQVPTVWFESANRASAGLLLKSTSATISMSGRLRESYVKDPSAQTFAQGC